METVYYPQNDFLEAMLAGEYKIIKLEELEIRKKLPNPYQFGVEVLGKIHPAYLWANTCSGRRKVINISVDFETFYDSSSKSWIIKETKNVKE